MANYYDILGVSKGSSDKAIKSAYRRMARKYHPDVNPGDKRSEERFKEISEAYDVLSDKKKRGQYDKVGHDAWKAGVKEGATPGGGAGYGWPGGGFPGADNFNFYTNVDPASASGASDFNVDDLFGSFFSGGRRRRQRGPIRGEDSLSRLAIPMKEAIAGGEKRITISSDRGKRETLTVKVPPGIREGQKIRLAGKGNPGLVGGPAGDLLIEIVYETQAGFGRENDNLTVDVPISFAIASLGGEVSVETLEGTAQLKIPPGTQGGQRMRLKSKGLPQKAGKRGDLFATIRIKVPRNLDEKGKKLIEDLGSYD